MTRNQIHVTSRRHRRPNFNSPARSRGFEHHDDIVTTVASTKKAAPWTGNEILVPITFDSASEHAFDAAVEMAKAMGGGILLLHVATRTYGGGFLEFAERESLQSEAVEASEERLAQLASEKREAKVPIRWVVKTGLPSYEILRLAETENAKAIILGRSPRNIVSRMLCGTVSRDVIDCSTCPVLVINTFGSIRSK